jgi:hypothetical protein
MTRAAESSCRVRRCNFNRRVISSSRGMEWTVPPHLEGHGHDVVVTLRCASRCHIPIDCTVAVRPERHGNVSTDAHRDSASQHHGRRAETGGEAAQANASRGHPQHRVSDIASHIDGRGGADVGCREARQARTRNEQLCRRLPIELQDGKSALGRLQRFGRRVLLHVPERRQLQDLRRVQGSRTGHRLAIGRDLGVLQQPGVEVGAAGVEEARRLGQPPPIGLGTVARVSIITA